MSTMGIGGGGSGSGSAIPRPRLVPWTGIAEWRYVADRILEGYGEDAERALSFAEMWCSRGNHPPAVESTVNIIKLQRYYEGNLIDSRTARLGLSSCLVRFVNEVVDNKQQGVFALPIAQLADNMNIPRLLVDIRHSSTHNQLPSLEVLLLGAKLALDWLRENYWEPQRNYELAIRQSTGKSLELFAQNFKECDPLTKSTERLVQKTLNEIQHVYYSREVQLPFLRTLLESPYPPSIIIPLIDTLAQKDERLILVLLDMAFLLYKKDNLPERFMEVFEQVATRLKSSKVVASCVKRCFLDPGRSSRRLLSAMMKLCKAHPLPDELESLIQVLLLEVPPLPLNKIMSTSELIIKTETFIEQKTREEEEEGEDKQEGGGEGWVIPNNWTPLPFGQTNSFNPIVSFQKLLGE